MSLSGAKAYNNDGGFTLLNSSSWRGWLALSISNSGIRTGRWDAATSKGVGALLGPSVALLTTSRGQNDKGPLPGRCVVMCHRLNQLVGMGSCDLLLSVLQFYSHTAAVSRTWRFCLCGMPCDVRCMKSF